MTKHARTGWMTATMSLALLAPLAANATSLKECSLKYKAAKTAGTLNGEDWKAFRAAQCGTATADAAPTAPAAGPAAAASPAPASIPATKPPTVTAPATGHATAAAGNPTFPTAVDAKYAKLSAGRARMKTCDDQYHANKNSGANGGLKWIEKGGGYFSQCNKRLKGA